MVSSLLYGFMEVFFPRLGLKKAITWGLYLHGTCRCLGNVRQWWANSTSYVNNSYANPLSQCLTPTHYACNIVNILSSFKVERPLNNGYD